MARGTLARRRCVCLAQRAAARTRRAQRTNDGLSATVTGAFSYRSAFRERSVNVITTGVESDAVRFGDTQPWRVPRLILELEDRAHRAVRDHALALEVPRAEQRVILPDRRAAGAE